MTDTITVTGWLPYAVNLIKQFEGCKLHAYPDPGSGGDPWTIGFGATGPGIARGLVWSQEQADKRLADDVARFGKGVVSHLGDCTANAHQIGAMVSLAYNIGLGSFAASSVLRAHKAGDFASARASFSKWVRAAGNIMPGLVRRRAAEAAVYGSDA